MMRHVMSVAVLLVIVGTGLAQAQNLLTNNSAYKMALQFRDEARQAIDNGNYDRAMQLSQEAEIYAKKAVEIANELALGYRAINLLNIAKARIQYGQSIKAPSRYPKAWQTAQEQVAVAQKEYDAKAYEKSMIASHAVIDALRNIHPPETVSTPLQPSSNLQKVLPEYYTVRLIPNRRDCFWRIAAYPFVYSDPYKWPILYQANKDKLQEPNNPNLIQPGMVFRVPSINGEKRQGMYQPPSSGASAP